MAIDPYASVGLGRSAVRVTRLGFGGASIGGLYRAVPEAQALATLDRAWDLGIRYFDVAPLYGYGRAEERFGRALRVRPRAEFTISTKVGRLLYPADRLPPGADRDRQALDGHDDAFYVDPPPLRPVFDFSFDGVLRSVEASLERLGLERIDALYIHDPDEHWQAAIDGAYPALDRLRAEGTVGAIGVGMNQAAMLARFAREGDFDVFLLAGRYTLLDQDALAELLPACVARGVSVVIGGAMNSGLLADPRPEARFDYAPAPADKIARAERLRTICERHGVPLKAAAVQFPFGHPAVASLVSGVRSVDHLEEYPDLLRWPIPADLWSELKAAGLLPDDAPTPPRADEPPAAR
jgi:D-threo-aldose 1-dehydrogenase